MNQLLVIEKLTTIFRMVFNDSNIILNNELTANDIDMWDSLTHMLMIEEVEKAFGIKFKLKDIIKLKNVQGLIELIELKLMNSI